MTNVNVVQQENYICTAEPVEGQKIRGWGPVVMWWALSAPQSLGNKWSAKKSGEGGEQMPPALCSSVVHYF